MRNILYKILPLYLGFLTLAGCEEEIMYRPLPETVPLTMSVNEKAFVMGEMMKVKIKTNLDADGNEMPANEDFDIYFTAKSGSKDVSDVFESFPHVVTFPKGATQIQIDFPVRKTGLEGDVGFDFTGFVRGYKMADATQSIKVADYYRVSLMLDGNSEGVVTEGDNFVIVASLDKPQAIPIDVNITVSDEEKAFFNNLPSKLTIPAGSLSVKSSPVDIVMDGQKTGDKMLTLNLLSSSPTNPTKERAIIIEMTDLESLSNPEMYDPTLVYPQPQLPFVSSKAKGNFEKWWTGEKTLIDRHTDAAPAPHPNATLAAAGWNFWYAVEYHFIQQSFGWSMPNPNEFGNFPHWANNNIPAPAMQSVFAFDRTKCTTVTEDGTLKVWAQAGASKTTNGQDREFASGAVYLGKGGKFMSTRFIHINPGMRIELRVRVTGTRTGIVPIIELKNAAGNVYNSPENTISILRNEKGNSVTQSVYSGTEEATKTNPIPKIGDWNIYWVELTDAGVKIGINGKTNVTVPQKESWIFNPKDGLALDFLLLHSENRPEGWDTVLRSISDPKKDPKTPTIEVDWVRFYTNDQYSDKGADEYWVNAAGNLFY